MPLKPIKTKDRLEQLKQNPLQAVKYAWRTFESRTWPDAEPYILKDTMVAMHYAYHVKQKLWPELEKILDGTRYMPMYNWNMRYFTY